MKLNQNAEEILEKRYYQKGEDWDTLCHRVCSYIADVYTDKEEKYRIFFEMMHSLSFLPNSPTMMNAGLNTEKGVLSACFILPIYDSLKGIYKTLRDAALINAGGGGTGFDFSTLRPKGALVDSTGGESSGPVSFMKVYDASADQIKQGGKRRSANMAVLRVDHPDILEFIDCKMEEGVLSNFNISVAITDEFMEAVKTNSEFPLKWNRKELPLKVVRAQDIWKKIIHGIWRNGEPGLIFIDKVNKVSGIEEEVTATNPCSEVGLPDYGSCNLGSINLIRMVDREKKVIDHSALKNLAYQAVFFLDAVITKNNYIIPEIEKQAMKYRPIGLGVMGFADVLLLLGIRYGSLESLELVKRIMATINDGAKRASKDLLDDFGPNEEGRDRRNAFLTSIAPTGTLSLIAGVSSSVEPNFAWEYESHRLGKTFKHIHPLVQKYLPYNKYGSKKPDYFVTTFEVPPADHLKVQSVFQEFVDLSISKTINLPYDFPESDMSSYLWMAYNSNCKGITMYRDRSRQSQVLVLKKEDGSFRPEELEGKTMKLGTGCGRIYVTLNKKGGRPFETFVTMGHGGTCISSNLEAIGRLLSVSMRHGVPIEDLIKQLKGIRCGKIVGQLGHKVYSCADAVGQALEKFVEINGKEKKKLEVKSIISGVCPECGGSLVFESGCEKCYSCGYSKCG